MVHECTNYRALNFEFIEIFIITYIKYLGGPHLQGVRIYKVKVTVFTVMGKIGKFRIRKISSSNVLLF